MDADATARLRNENGLSVIRHSWLIFSAGVSGAQPEPSVSIVVSLGAAALQSSKGAQSALNQSRKMASSTCSKGWCVLLFHLFLVAVVLISSSALELDESLLEVYFFACSGGRTDKIQTLLDEHGRDLASAKTKDGETCLHLCSIDTTGQAVHIARALLQAGADPNVRTTFEQGQRMHPLSWHVFAGNHDIVKLLLDAGANINDDFDLHPPSAPVQTIVTALDIAEKLSGVEDMADSVEKEENDKTSNGGGDDSRDRFKLTYDLLKSRGGKKWEDIVKERAASEELQDL